MRALIVGASGFIGAALRAGLPAAWRVVGTSSGGRAGLARLDVTDGDEVHAALASIAPDVVLYLPALNSLEGCEEQPARARAIHVVGAQQVAEAAGRARIVYFSTDYVFNGEHPPYRESAPPTPLNMYGLTKAEGEAAVLTTAPSHLVLRLPLIYGLDRRATGSAKPDFIPPTLDALRAGQRIALDAAQVRYPILVDDLVAAVTHVVESDCSGILHLAGPEGITKYEWGRRLANRLGLPATLIDPETAAGPVPKPRDAQLVSERGEGHALTFRGVEAGLSVLCAGLSGR